MTLRGWTARGAEILLLDWQEKAVRELLAAWTADRAPQLPQVGRQGGKTVVLITAAHYEQHWDQGHPLPDDPRLTLAGDDHDELLASALRADPGRCGSPHCPGHLGLDDTHAALDDEASAPGAAEPGILAAQTGPDHPGS